MHSYIIEVASNKSIKEVAICEDQDLIHKILAGVLPSLNWNNMPLVILSCSSVKGHHDMHTGQELVKQFTIPGHAGQTSKQTIVVKSYTECK